MAYFKKKVYDNKREWAAKRMTKNLEKGKENGLTEEQCELLERLCTFRHNLHCNQEDLFYSERQYYKEFWFEISNEYDEDKIAISLEESGLGCPFTLVVQEDMPDDVFWNDEEAVRPDGTIIPIGIDSDDDESFWEKHEIQLGKILEVCNNINNEIEKYLYDIDKIYGTNYCPSGATRLF